jgi:hypothetical protein
MVTSFGDLAFFVWVAYLLARGDVCADFSDANPAKIRLFENFFHPVRKPLQHLIDFLGELWVIRQDFQLFPDVQRPECVNGQ